MIGEHLNVMITWLQIKSKHIVSRTQNLFGNAQDFAPEFSLVKKLADVTQN